MASTLIFQYILYGWANILNFKTWTWTEFDIDIEWNLFYGISGYVFYPNWFQAQMNIWKKLKKIKIPEKNPQKKLELNHE